MALSKVELQNFRSYEKSVFDFSPTVTIITGPNGSGKTNILEAVYVLARGTSFRGTDDNLLQFEAPWWRIEAHVGDGKRSITYNPHSVTAKKQTIINSVKKQRMPANQKLPLVLFEPNDLRLLSGSPTRRRSYIDAFVAQFEPSYVSVVNRYDRALKQRNNILKRPHTNDELFVWDVTLSELGATILAKRQEYADFINQYVSKVYSTIADARESVKLEYRHGGTTRKVTQYQQWLLAQLDTHRERDKYLGFTSTGPHRDDIAFLLNKHDAATSASRGETRSIVLALKLLEVQQLFERADTPPLFLLDDVFSELDRKRRAKIAEVSGTIAQTVITTTNADIHKRFGGKKVRRISLGEY
jgi:DNA replication and repair protein RecF